MAAPAILQPSLSRENSTKLRLPRNYLAQNSDLGTKRAISFLGEKSIDSSAAYHTQVSVSPDAVYEQNGLAKAKRSQTTHPFLAGSWAGL
ncbi:hypothetical protein AV530_017603 [Patagioenas fasciata monilis]|uniref:Uncharacterized protein n=1 Tax=Patagioenas fasciata monilis TaxID=372326 RepID=A0A1V4J9D0_PATFA|nr:hypothetical protein AV530_017603 [Patagioenas fasciata monilis]